MKKRSGGTGGEAKRGKARRLFSAHRPEQPFRILPGQMSEGVATLNAHGKILSCNDRFAKMAGFPAERILATPLASLLCEQERLGLPELLRLALEGGDIRRESSLRTANSTALPVQLSLCRMLLEESAPGICLVATDLGGRKRLEDELCLGREWLNGILQSAMDGIITVDEEQRIVLFNSAAEKIFRCPAVDALGEPLNRFIPPRFHAAHDAHIRSFRETGVTNRAVGRADVLWAARADGEEFQMEASISQVVVGEKRLFTVILRDVTEHRQAEAKLKWLAAVVESSDDAIVGKDLNGIVTAWNAGAEKVFGYTAVEAIGKPMLMLFPPERVAEEADILARIGRGESVEHFETVRVRKDGSLIDVSVTISPIRDGAGRIVGASKIARDITERKRTEQALSESHARLKRVLEVETVGVLFWDLTTGALMDANSTFLNLMGYSRRDVEAGELTWQKLTPPEYQEVSRAELRKFAETGRVGPYEKEYLHKDGTRQWFVFAGSSLGDNSCVEFCVDISDRKKAEAALQESEERFHTLIEQASDAFFLHDGDGRFLEVNREACESLGYTREELLRMSVFDVEHEIGESKARQAWEQAEPGKAYTIQGRQRRKDGTSFPIEVRLSACYIGGQKLHLGLVRDTTERMRAEEALRRSDAGRVVALEAANLGEWEIDLSTQATRRSRRHDQIFGFASAAEWSPEIFFQHVHPEDRERARMNLEEAIRQGTKLETECRIVLPDGEIRWIRACGDRYRDSAGNSTRMFGTVEDITGRKRTAEALRLSEERLRLAMDGAQLGTWHWNLESGELEWSPRCLALFGLPPDAKMTYDIFRSALHPDDRAATDQAVRRSLDEHAGFDIEYRAIWPDGSQHWLAAKGQAYYDPARKAVRMEGVVMDVTERREAEERLRQSEENYRTLFDSMDEAFCTIEVLFDENGKAVDYRFLEVNPAFSQHTGIENARGRRIREISPHQEEYWYEIFGEVALTGQPTRFENEAAPLHRWFEVHAFRIGEPHERRVAILFNDITERRRQEAALRESQQRFQAMANGIPQLAWMAEPDGHIFWYNQRWYDYTGTAFEQMEGWGWQRVHDPEVLPEVLESWSGSIARGEPFDMEFPLRAADGRFRMFLTRVMPSLDSEGRVTRWFGTNTDISKQKESERQLAELAQELARQAAELAHSRQALETQKLMLQSVLDSMVEGLVVADEHGKFTIWNPAAARIVGLSAANLPPEQWSTHYGRYLPDMLTLFPADQDPLLRAIRGEVSSAEMFIRNPELEHGVWIESNGAPLKDKNGVVRGGLVAFRDITQKKEADLEIRKLNETLEERIARRTAQLEVANRELESFTYSVSHDLRAPLRHIGSFAAACLEEFGTTLDPQALHYLQRIQEGARRMGLLTDELLNLARTGQRPLHLQLTGLNSIVEEIISMLKTETEGREVEWKISNLPSVECDPVLVRQVFQNLLSNAIKYSRRRPHAVIEIGHIQEKDRPIIFVRDNGAGFNMQYADKLFGVFQRLHREEEFEGTGVGLATVHRIVQKHGGRIWAEAELDKGATFYFTLAGSEGAGSRSNGAAAGGAS